MAMLQEKKFVRVAVALALVALSVAVACASGGAEGAHHADSGAVAKDFAWRVLDFGLMAILLVYLLTKPIRGGVRSGGSQFRRI